ncbi:MAG: hypothetical protein N4A43_00225 [Alphaproteobacteria bacterium]|jgi:hypothetical protein|nr:hypothetical protein [Alphaproteobacteria bacterium]
MKTHLLLLTLIFSIVISLNSNAQEIMNKENTEKLNSIKSDTADIGSDVSNKIQELNAVNLEKSGEMIGEGIKNTKEMADISCLKKLEIGASMPSILDIKKALCDVVEKSSKIANKYVKDSIKDAKNMAFDQVKDMTGGKVNLKKKKFKVTEAVGIPDTKRFKELSADALDDKK